MQCEHGLPPLQMRFLRLQGSQPRSVEQRSTSWFRVGLGLDNLRLVGELGGIVSFFFLFVWLCTGLIAGLQMCKMFLFLNANGRWFLEDG